MNIAYYIMPYVALATWVKAPIQPFWVRASRHFDPFPRKTQFAPLRPLRNWLEQIPINEQKFAHWVCKMIPPQCPFERDIKLLGRVLFHIPPLCKLNPFYEEFVSLRFRALCYLADECGEDISAYC